MDFRVQKISLLQLCCSGRSLEGQLPNKLQSYVNLFHVGPEVYNQVKQFYGNFFTEVKAQIFRSCHLCALFGPDQQSCWRA